MMKLRHSHTSPYARKVMVAALETGLASRITLVDTNPWAAETDLMRDNPLYKIPCLITEGGEALYDSPVICEYLDSLHDGVRLIPPTGGARWTVLRRQALADGIMDAAILRRVELTQKAEAHRSIDWLARQSRTMMAALDTLDEEADSLGAAVTLGHIAIGCALGYIDFRFPDDQWRKGRRRLARWFEQFAARAAMIETSPPLA